MSTLRERLADAGFAWTIEERIAITEIVAEWLRDQAAIYDHTDQPAEKQIRYELRAMADTLPGGKI